MRALVLQLPRFFPVFEVESEFGERNTNKSDTKHFDEQAETDLAICW